jgi:predicted Zn-dependent protease
MIAILAPALFVLTASFSPPASSAHSQGAAAHSAASFDELALEARLAREENRNDAVIELYRQALKLKPEWDEGLWYLGEALYEKGSYLEACDVLRHYLALDPQSAIGWALLGLSEFQTRQYARVLGHLDKGTTLGLGENRKTLLAVDYVTAILLTRSEQYDDATSLLYRVRGEGEIESNLEVPFGLAALRVPLLPDEIPADRREMIQMAGKAVVALEAQRYDEAEKLLTELEAAYPDQPGVHFLFGAYLLGVRSDDGIREMKREIEISPWNVPARVRLAEEYLKRKEIDQAMVYTQEALKLEPKESAALMLMGECLLAKGDSAGGIRQLEAARDSAPDMVQLHWDLLRAYTAAGRKEDAAKEKSEIERLSKDDAQQ